LLRFIKVDVIAERSGFEAFLLTGGIRLTTVSLVGMLFYWFIIFVTVLAALKMLGMTVASELFSKAMFYIPSVIVAIVVIIFGSLIAKFVQSVLYVYLNNIGVGSATLLSTIAQYTIMVFVLFVALEHLAIGGIILTSAFQLAFGALCLAAAIAFGLGGKDAAARFLERYIRKHD